MTEADENKWVERVWSWALQQRGENWLAGVAPGAPPDRWLRAFACFHFAGPDHDELTACEEFLSSRPVLSPEEQREAEAEFQARLSVYRVAPGSGGGVRLQDVLCPQSFALPDLPLPPGAFVLARLVQSADGQWQMSAHSPALLDEARVQPVLEQMVGLATRLNSRLTPELLREPEVASELHQAWRAASAQV